MCEFIITAVVVIVVATAGAYWALNTSWRTIMYEFISLVVICIVVAVGSYWASCISCSQRGESFEDSNYGVYSGCMVKHKGKWLPLDNIRGFDGR